MLDRPLRIFQVSTADIDGGAERIAWNLFRCYRSFEQSSWLAVGKKRSDDPDVILINNNVQQGWWSRLGLELEKRIEPVEEKKRKFLCRLQRAALRTLASPRHELKSRLGVEDFDHPGTRQLLQSLPEKPDVIHFHNLHGGYFDLRVLPSWSKQMPLVLTLHDAWLLSGHCAHSLDCERWKGGCGHCPYLNIYPAIARDSTAYNWKRKQKIYAASRFYLATPSQWLMRKVAQSMIAPAVAESRVIANGVDLSVFKPAADRQALRATLGLPSRNKVLLFTANGIRRNVWKDYPMMRAAVARVAESLRGEGLLFIALGESGPAEHIGPAEVRFVPYQEDPQALARYYQAADVYIHAAHAEVWGLTITEALACGTPVVATAVGGIPEQIKGLRLSDCEAVKSDVVQYGPDEATGILVPLGDACAMASAIEHLLQDPLLRLRMGRNATQDAHKRFGLQQQAHAFLRWYREIVSDWRGVKRDPNHRGDALVRYSQSFASGIFDTCCRASRP